MLAGCTGPFSTLDPAGTGAARIAELWWVMLAGAALILAGVMAMAFYSLRRDRSREAISERSMLIGGGLVFPILVLSALMAFALYRGERMLARPADNVPVVDAIASQYGWVFRYPGHNDLQTRDVIHVPAGRIFHVRITSDDVIHSFWVPRLGGKIDAIPGRVNMIALQADEPGRYRGRCAEYCGIGHASMLFDLVAHPEEDYSSILQNAADMPPSANISEETEAILKPRDPAASSRIVRGYESVLRWLGMTP